MICPMCGGENVEDNELFRACIDCGASTSFVFNPRGDEPNLPELIESCWVKKVLGFVTPLDKRPSFSYDPTNKWTVTLDIFPEPFVSLSSPEEGVALCIAAFQVAKGITPDRYVQIKAMYDEEVENDPEGASSNYLERATRIANWIKRVEEMDDL